MISISIYLICLLLVIAYSLLDLVNCAGLRPSTNYGIHVSLEQRFMEQFGGKAIPTENGILHRCSFKGHPDSLRKYLSYMQQYNLGSFYFGRGTP
jgi:hypothetical protein